MGNGDTVTQTGRTQPFPGKQAVGDGGSVEIVQLFEKQAGFFKSPFLTGGFYINKNLWGGQNGGKSVHGKYNNAEFELCAQIDFCAGKNPKN